MAPVASVSEFLDLLKRSGLLGIAAFRQALEKYELDALSEPREAADRLVAHGVITRYQANRLLDGRRRGLFIDEYKILELLGCGGMGYLYAAEEMDTGWQVALKVLSDRYRHDKGRLTRFQMEAEAGLKLSHPNILRTRAMKRTEDIYGVIHYMVLELVKGVNLRELIEIRKRTVGFRHACDIICQAAAGLQSAHEMGMVHRDVKPENLLIRSDGAVKVLDFGLAMVGGSDLEMPMATILDQRCLGTADYIAPEQVRDSVHVDARADIYSLGCTFYFLVTGQVPFPVESIRQKLEGHRREKPQPLQEINPKIPDGIARIIRRMMAKRPENRIQTATEVIALLSRVAQRKPIEFDFEAVLRQRARVAEHRLATESILRGDSRTTSVSRPEMPPPGLKSPATPDLLPEGIPLPPRKE